LEFYEALKTDDSDATVVLPIPQKSPVAPSPAPREIAGKAPPLHKKRATLMPKREAVAQSPVSVQPRKTETPSRTAGTLTIQVASVKDGAAAERIVANLKKDGYSAFLVRSVIPGKGLWFRVRVGSYANREQAAADIDRLTRSGKKTMLVKKITKDTFQ
jgi:cell division protein FtsN